MKTYCNALKIMSADEDATTRRVEVDEECDFDMPDCGDIFDLLEGSAAAPAPAMPVSAESSPAGPSSAGPTSPSCDSSINYSPCSSSGETAATDVSSSSLLAEIQELKHRWAALRAIGEFSEDEISSQLDADLRDLTSRIVAARRERSTSCPASEDSSESSEAGHDAATTRPVLAPRRSFVCSASYFGQTAVRAATLPALLANDEHLFADIANGLPAKYNFEVHKIVWRVLRLNAELQTVRTVGLQLPDGLVAWGPVICAILEKHCTKYGSELSTLLLADVTYGACCIDDLSARQLGVDLLVHFGHSCLVPVLQSVVRTMYVHVSIAINVDHLVGSLLANFGRGRDETTPGTPYRREEMIQESFVATGGDHAGEDEENLHDASRVENAQELLADEEVSSLALAPLVTPAGEKRLGKVAVLTTVQFSPAVQTALKKLKDGWSGSVGPIQLHTKRSQVRPLGATEVLGCTAPDLGPDVEEVFFVCDGRFHLEAAMIRNPHVDFYLYNPYAKTLTRERYDYAKMLELRGRAVEGVREMVFGEDLHSGGDGTTKHPTNDHVPTCGVVLGTLGRQGNVALMGRLQELLSRAGVQHQSFLLPEISPEKLRAYESSYESGGGGSSGGGGRGEEEDSRGIDFWVQIACPRLSVDWGGAFTKPCLTPYEIFVLLESFCDEEDKNHLAKARAAKRENIDRWKSRSKKTTVDVEAVVSAEGLGGGSCGCGSGTRGCGAGEAPQFDGEESLWPEMDYYDNKGGPWSNYGGTGISFLHTSSK